MSHNYSSYVASQHSQYTKLPPSQTLTTVSMVGGESRKRQALGDMSNVPVASVPSMEQHVLKKSRSSGLNAAKASVNGGPRKTSNVAALAAQVVKDRALKSSRLRVSSKARSSSTLAAVSSMAMVSASLQSASMAPQESRFRAPVISQPTAKSEQLLLAEQIKASLELARSKRAQDTVMDNSEITSRHSATRRLSKDEQENPRRKSQDRLSVTISVPSESTCRTATASSVSAKRDSGISVTSITASSVIKRRARLSTSTSSEISRSGTAVVSTTSVRKSVVSVVPKSMPVMLNVDDALGVDPLMAEEYAPQIFRYLREAELRNRPRAQYMTQQTEIDWSMRAVLVDWMVQVHEKFRLLPETLFLSISYLDRFLSSKLISVQKLQLAGVSSLMIAAKFEEIHPPRLREWVYAVDGGYGHVEILKAERFVLSNLQFDVSSPNPYQFLRRISRADGYQSGPRTLSKYFLEVMLLDERFLAFPMSQVTAAAMFLSLKMISNSDWTRAHEFYSGYMESDLMPVVMTLLDLVKRPGLEDSHVFKKYASSQFMRGAEYVKDCLAKWGW